MASSPARGADPQIGVTPLIDVCVLLLVFFMLSMNVQTVEERIESELPRDRCPCPGPYAPDIPAVLKVRLVRPPSPDTAPVPTRVRVGEAVAVRLPPFPERAREEALLRIRERIAAWREAVGGRMLVEAEVGTPPPHGARVTHGDVMAVVDCLLGCGFDDIQFEGAMPPVFTAGQGGVIERH